VHLCGNSAPKVENFHILVKSRPRGVRLTDFYSYWGHFYAQLSCINILHLMWFASNYALDTTKWLAPFKWFRRALSPCKVWGRSYNARRLLVRKHRVCMVFFLFFCHAPRPAHCSFEGCIVWTRIVCSCEIANMLWGIPYFRPRSLSSRKEAAGESKYPDK